MKTGTIKRFLEDKGFGFIEEDVSKQEWFYSKHGLVDPNDLLKAGDRVAFETKDDKNGAAAIRVKRA